MYNWTFLLFVALPFISQGQSYDWVHHFIAPGSDFSSNIKFDDDGNVYSTGFYRDGGIVIGGETLPFSETMDSYLTKVNSSGNILWTIPFYGPGVFDRTEGLQIDEDGNLYLLSTIEDAMQIGNQLALSVDSSNGVDILLAKFNPDGDLLWHKIFGGRSTDLAYNFRLRGEDLLLVGHYLDSIVFDDIILVNPTTRQNMFMASIDTSGTPIWARQYGGNGHDRLYEVYEHANGDLAVCGYADGPWTFGTTDLDSTDAQFDGFVGRLTSQGDPIWARQLLSQDRTSSTMWTTCTDQENNTYVATFMNGTTAIDSLIFDAGDAFQLTVIKYSPSGALEWLHVAETNNSTDFSGGFVIEFLDDKIWVGGSIGSVMSFMGQEFTDLDTTTAYLFALDTSGQLLADWLTGRNAYGNIAALDFLDDKLAAAIYFDDEGQFGDAMFTSSGTDIVIAQLDVSDITSSNQTLARGPDFTVFPNPARDHLSIIVPNGIYDHVHILNASGQVLLSLDTGNDLDISHLAPGQYYVHMIAKTHQLVKPFVIVD